MSYIAVLILNWNGGSDTIECLDSFIWPMSDAHFFIVDNASPDNSVEKIKDYLNRKNIGFSEYTRAELKNGFETDTDVSLILNPSNEGFAAGNNLILKKILNTGQFKYAWLLNNDTTVNENTLRELECHMKNNSDVAFCGSVILDYYRKELIQCCGVNHYKYLGVSKLHLKNRRWAETKHSPQLMNTKQDYQNGASLFVDMHKIKKIGLMDETFFLYAEEADWQIRAQRKGYRNSLCWESLVYHKGSAGTAGRKHIFFYHYNRSSIIMTRKNFGMLASFTASLSLVAITVLRSALNIKAILFGLRGIRAGWQINYT